MGGGNRRSKGMRTIFAGAIILVALYIGIGYSAVQAPETATATGSTHAGSSLTMVDAAVPDRGPISVSVLIAPELALSDGEDAISTARARGPYGFHPPAEVAAPAAIAASIAGRHSAPPAEEGALAGRVTIPSDSQAEATAESAETQAPAGVYYLLVTPGASADPVASAKPGPAVAAKSTGAPSGHLSDGETAPSGPAAQANASSASSGHSANTGSAQSPNNDQSGGGPIAGGGAASSGGASASGGSGSDSSSGGGQIAGGGSAASSGGTSTSSGNDSDSGNGNDSSAGASGQSSGSAGGVVGAAGNAVRGAVGSVGKAAAGAVGGVSHAAGGLAGAVGGKLGK